jgi:hypothetical protein
MWVCDYSQKALTLLEKQYIIDVNTQQFTVAWVKSPPKSPNYSSFSAHGFFAGTLSCGHAFLRARFLAGTLSCGHAFLRARFLAEMRSSKLFKPIFFRIFWN